MAWEEKRDANGQPYYQQTVAGTGALEFKNAYAGAVSTWRVQINVNGSTVSGTFKGKAAFAETAKAPYVSLPYQKLDAATIDIAAGTAVTASSIYMVRADGLDVEFDLTTHTGGSGCIVYIAPMLG